MFATFILPTVAGTIYVIWFVRETSPLDADKLLFQQSDVTNDDVYLYFLC